MLGVGLGATVYIWDANSSKVTKIFGFRNPESTSSLAWSPNGSILAIGSSHGDL